MCRYVERNPLRAGLVRKAEDWRWGSLWQRTSGAGISAAGQAPVTYVAAGLLDDWPVDCPPNWIARVNQAETGAELEALRRCVRRGLPYGRETWVAQTAEALGLASLLRAPGRPRKAVTRESTNNGF